MITGNVPPADALYLGSEEDIRKAVRSVQLSKSAILSGISILLDKFKLSAGALDEIIIAGQSGNHLTPDMLINTGFLPNIAKEKISYMKNTSLDGAVSVVLDVKKKKYRTAA